MDRLLRRELDAIARDRRSGAAELALSAVTALQSWLRRHPQPSKQELLDIARALLRVQPSMAPLLRLANEVALAADSRSPARYLAAAAASFRNLLQNGPRRIARLLGRALRLGRHKEVITYSYSSTVLAALARARFFLERVYCSESRPGYEGRAMADRLARAGVQVWFETDAALFGRVSAPSEPLVLGADAILRTGFVNKVGTSALVQLGLHAGAPVWVLIGTLKFWPRWFSRFAFMCGPPRQVWKPARKRILVLNPYFGVTSFHPSIRFLTERGWMTPTQVRGELKRIRISPRLKALAD
jgi:translation initiation factor 2B subunit (eIF-2B alpha/beta/delta family)